MAKFEKLTDTSSITQNMQKARHFIQAMLPLFNFLECLAYYALMLNNVICIVKYIELMLKEIVLKKVYTFILKLKKLLFFF